MSEGNQAKQAVQENAENKTGTTYTVVTPPKKEDSAETQKLKENFGFFGPATLLYAVIYAFCMFQNGSGITFPFFMAASLVFLYFTLSKLEITLRRGSGFYMAGIMLLAVSTFCTDDWRIINLNKTGIFLLMMSLLLHQFCDTGQWRLGKYLAAICQLVFASMGELGRPFTDGAAYYREKGKQNRKLWNAVLGAVIAVPLLLVVAVLLSAADALFRQMTNHVIALINPGNLVNVVLRIAFIFFASYGLTAYLCKHAISDQVKDRRKGEPILAITITGLLSLIYLLFSGIQIFGLFLGRMQLPEEYTYAMYAREGFFQLLAVSILNLIIVLVCMSFFKESRLLKAILTIMSLCTFIMIASSFMRMIIYIRYYYLTFLRIFVLWALVVLALLFAGVIVSIFKERFPLFRYSVVVVTVLYLALSFVHPDYIIAAVNVANAPASIAEDAVEAEVLAVRTESGTAEAAEVLAEGTESGTAEAAEKLTAETESEAAEAAGQLETEMQQPVSEEYGKDFFSGPFFLGEAYEDYSYLSTLSADAAPVLLPYMKELGYDISVIEEESIFASEKLSDKDVGRWRISGFGYYYLNNVKQRLDKFSWRTFNVSRWIMLRRINKL